MASARAKADETDLFGVSPVPSQLKLARFDARQLNQSVYETVQAVALFVDDFHHLNL